MQKEKITRNEIKLVGIKIRTNNANEMNPATAKIGRTVFHYLASSLANQIPNRIKPTVTYCVYTEYASDFMGDFTYLVGEEVSAFAATPEGFAELTIPAQTYAKFTTEPGTMPQVCIAAWQQIWTMSPDTLGAERSYVADFEIYDERAMTRDATVLDICIGLKG